MFDSKSCQGFSLKTGLVILLGCAGLFGVAPASAAVLNGGFEDGNFNSWEIVGRTSIETTEDESGSTEGTYQAMLNTVCPAYPDRGCTAQTAGGNDVELAEFLGLEVDDLNALDNGEVFEGSAMQTTITVEAGDVLTFTWNFLTGSTEGDGGEFNDYAFVTISGTTDELVELADTFSTFVESATAYEYETGFQTFEYTFTTSGTYTLGIGVVDVGDGGADSELLVDNVSISSSTPSTSVPDSASALGVLAFGAFGVGSRLLRQHLPRMGDGTLKTRDTYQ